MENEKQERICGEAMQMTVDTTDSDEQNYQLMASGSSEYESWPGFKAVPIEYHKKDGYRRCATPLLISECGRLVVQWDKENRVYRTSPFNMPKVEVEIIELVGTILSTTTYNSFLQFEVYDGTGIITVNYNIETYKQLVRRREELDDYYGITPQMLAKIMKITDTDFESRGLRRINRLWWTASRQGMLGKILEDGDYVNIFGFCAPTRRPHDDDDDDAQQYTTVTIPMSFVAVHLDAIDEKTYEKKFRAFVHGGLEKYRAKSARNSVGNPEGSTRGTDKTRDRTKGTKIQDLLDDIETT